MRRAPCLPAEICDNIIDHLHDDVAALRACSLTVDAIDTMSKEDVDRLGAVLASSPRLGRHIKRVDLHAHALRRLARFDLPNLGYLAVDLLHCCSAEEAQRWCDMLRSFPRLETLDLFASSMSSVGLWSLLRGVYTLRWDGHPLEIVTSQDPSDEVASASAKDLFNLDGLEVGILHDLEHFMVVNTLLGHLCFLRHVEVNIENINADAWQLDLHSIPFIETFQATLVFLSPTPAILDCLSLSLAQVDSNRRFRLSLTLELNVRSSAYAWFEDVCDVASDHFVRPHFRHLRDLTVNIDWNYVDIPHILERIAMDYFSPLKGVNLYIENVHKGTRFDPSKRNADKELEMEAVPYVASERE
ncbi:hypothetical protein PUNSTDRAFT_44675 [Punctularia strigosozonata HHB-11173 SS5]|uniref:uncharacterized protein n=1 Tax=Punctularia strigosozonata (strain HHB-11173) TaxID=741275 RepID=UPI000441710F|nr:uncharacterized protein PUNSTDRAFT_44675 [Punctularia strigosozonata HHB-11173 SS5]EIN09298.1 hypothetical protein PUNSTDRAFT_44675 [Punctularia strigosozonata HHB-11173 SS5]